MKYYIKRITLGAALTMSLATTALASAIMDIPCQIVRAVASALAAIGPLLVAIMFTYGGVKYVYSADDPGGRKQGKTTMIHAIIGAILMGLVVGVIALVPGAAGNMCGVDTIFS